MTTASGKPRRPKWVWGLGIIVILGLAAWGFLSPRTPSAPPPQPAASVKNPRMEGLSLTEIQEGDKRWVLEAKKADFHPDKMTISISGVRVEFFGPGEDIRVKADEGLFHTKTRVLTLRGHVEMKRGDLLIKTAEATYIPDQRVLLAPREVTIHEPRLTVTGKELRVELAAKKLIMAQHQITEVKVRDWGIEP
jgi:LPS export ABC transporter protein LptC